MKDLFFRSSPFVLTAVGAGIWPVVFVSGGSLSPNAVLISCIIIQLLLFFYSGTLIRKYHRQANIDSLTGICNRRYFFTKVSAMLRIKSPVSLMMIDVDNFKRINDTYGHSSGDAVLKLLAGILKSNTDCTDIVARLGGEEFAVFLPKNNYKNVFLTAEKIKRAVEEKSFSFACGTDKITISIGVVTSVLPIDIDCLLKYADGALYKAKETKNAVVEYK